MCSCLVDAQQHGIACRNFLNIEIAAMRTVVDREDSAMHRRDPNDSDHRLYRQLQVLVPVHQVILHLDDPRLSAEFFSPHPIGKHSDARPQRRKTQIAELHLKDLDVQHVADFRSPHFDRAGCTIYERQRDVGLGSVAGLDGGSCRR